REPGPVRAAAEAPGDSLVRRAGDAQMQVIIVRGAVARLEQDVLRIPDELRILAPRAGILDHQRLQPVSEEEPLHIGLFRADEGLYQQPLALKIDAEVFPRALRF